MAISGACAARRGGVGSRARRRVHGGRPMEERGVSLARPAGTWATNGRARRAGLIFGHGVEPALVRFRIWTWRRPDGRDEQPATVSAAALGARAEQDVEGGLRRPRNARSGIRAHRMLPPWVGGSEWFSSALTIGRWTDGTGMGPPAVTTRRRSTLQPAAPKVTAIRRRLLPTYRRARGAAQ